MKDELNLKDRTRKFAISVVRFYTSLPKKVEIQTLGRQLLRSGTSVGAHYREGCRAKSDADFISKIEGALQELEESAYWLELLAELEPGSNNQSLRLVGEVEELTAIFVSIVRKVKGA